MPAVSTVTVTVPATTANLGSGFDCIGAALTLYNCFRFTSLEAGSAPSMQVRGSEAHKVKTDQSNLVYQAFVKFYQHIKQTVPSVQIEISMDVPLARGLGSSATAIVGGLVGANQLAGAPLSQTEVMELAIAMEGHPDNVVPALLGGCRLAATGNVETQYIASSSWVICDVPWSQGVIPVVAIPDFELSTAEARRVLPTQVSRADAIFNTAHLGLLLRGLETGRADWLRAALQDRLHQPYRSGLIRGYEAVHKAAIASGALGMVISGAGPTLLALVTTERAADVARAMEKAWQQEGVKAIVRSLSIDTQGARCN